MSSSSKVWGKFCGANLREGAALHGGTNVQIMSIGESFANAFFSNLNPVNLEIFPHHGGIYI